METPSDPATARGARLQAVLCAAGFILLLAGTNATTPLLPVYRDVLGFSSLTVTLTFFIYVAALVSALFIAAHPSLARRAPAMLVAAIALSFASDLLLATGTVRGILAGRMLAGLSGGIGTGAASALVVAAIGVRGRALSATGNLAGAILGTTVSEIVLQATGVRATALCFQFHAVACALLAIPLVALLLARRAENRRLIGGDSAPGAPVRPVLRRQHAVLMTGSLAWIAISAAIVFLPTYFSDHNLPLVQALGIPVLLSSSLIAQLATPWLARRMPWVSGMGPLALGVASILVAARFGAISTGVAGFALVGAGAGLAYRTALLRLTRGASPATQGRLASLYAAITYSVAAAVVLSCGALAQAGDPSLVIMWILLISGLLALAAIPVAPRIGPAD
ncbi:MFS transporter [Tropicimonas sp.]|uniref:MFS transporter n=1 Tax=Tropicimonas sp. TaxID=2067044 RepID=UPI003A847C33